MTSTTLFLLTGLLVLFGATVASLTGFGFAIATMPFFLLLYPPKVAVPLSITISILGGLMQWLRVRKHADNRLVGLMVLGAAGGVPLGSYVLIAADAATLKVLISLAVLVAAAVSMARKEQPGLPVRRPGTWITTLTGFGAGVMSSSVGQPGLLAGLFMARTRLDKAIVRATLVSFFLLTNSWSLTTLYVQGMVPSSLAVTGLSLAPFYWVGLALGDVGFRRSTPIMHRRLSLGFLALSSVVGLVNGLVTLV